MIVFKQEIREIRAIVRDLLGDRAPTRWQGIAQVEYMVRKMPDDLSPAQVAGLYALQSCELFYVLDECPDVMPEPDAIETLRDKAQQDLLSFADYLPDAEAKRVRSIAKLFEESSDSPAQTQRVVEGRQLFDLLQKPQQLNWLEVALIREGTKAERIFEQRYGVPVNKALRILFAWESAQSIEWDRGLLADFFDPEIYPDRRLVRLRIDAAMPERFATEAGLQWLERERIPVGDLLVWVRENLRTQAVSEPQATPPSTVQNGTVTAPVLAASASAGTDQTLDPERRLARLRALGGSCKYVRGGWKFIGIEELVRSEKAEGRKRSDEKTIRADLKDAAQTERDAKSAGFGAGLGQR